MLVVWGGRGRGRGHKGGSLPWLAVVGGGWRWLAVVGGGWRWLTGVLGSRWSGSSSYSSSYSSSIKSRRWGGRQTIDSSSISGAGMAERLQWYLLVSVSRSRPSFGAVARGDGGRGVRPQRLAHLLQFIPPHPPHTDGGDDVALGPVRQRPAADAQCCRKLSRREKGRCWCCCRSRPSGGGGFRRRQVGDRVQCHNQACQVVGSTQIECWYEPACISWYDILLGSKF